MPTRRALLAALCLGLAGCGTARRPHDPGTAAPPPMDYEPGTPNTPTPRSSPLPVDRSFRWPEPFFDAANTSHVPTSGPSAAPDVEWEVWLDDVDAAEHALIDGQWLHVFGDGRLVVLDRRTGGVNRSVDLSAETRTAPVLAGEGFVAGALTRDRNRGIALQGTVGELYWRRRGGNLVIPPATDGERIYVPMRSELVARDVADGSVVWRSSAHEGDTFATYPAVAGETVYVHGSNGSTYAVDAGSGEVRWRASTEGGHTPTVVPTVAGSIVIGGFEGGVGTVAYDRERGERVWQTEQSVPVGSHAVAGDRVVAASAGGRVAALSRAGGGVEWTARGGAGRPVVADGTVFVRGEREGDDGTERVHALSFADGSRRWQRPASGDGWLLVADGYCYLNRGDGVIQCWG